MGYAVICASSSLALAALWLFSRLTARRPRIFVAPGSYLDEILKAGVPCLNQVFYPTWWCPFGFLQTIVRQVFRDCPDLPFEREIFLLDDGGEVAVDWLHPNCETSDVPIIIFLPGITGSTYESSYVIHTALECSKQGYRTAVLNQRGLGGIALKTSRTYNAAWTTDFRYIVQVLNERYSTAPKISCGFSLGGMIVWNYLSECEKQEETGLTAAVCVSSPFNPHEATETIEEFFPRLIFNSRLVESLKKIVRPYRSLFNGICDWGAVLSAKTVREFDEAFTVPVFGYRTIKDYYDDAALYWKVDKIPIPTVCLNAADDCFSPLHSIPFDNILKNKNVAVVVTRHGGHIAFMNSANPTAPGLIENFIVQFVSVVLDSQMDLKVN